jgi:predicted phosphoribosyltransferase
MADEIKLDFPDARHFSDRGHAGRLLAEVLSGTFRGRPPLILGLPRGGVPVAWEVARRLGAPLDVLVVRKVGVPGEPELAMGAVAEGGIELSLPEVITQRPGAAAAFEALAKIALREVGRRVSLLRPDRPRSALKDRTVVLVDDGVATGATMRVAIRACQAQGVSEVTVAVPVCARDALATLRSEADRVVTLLAPVSFDSVAQWYDAFPQVDDPEVVDLLRRAQDTIDPDTVGTQGLGRGDGHTSLGVAVDGQYNHDPGG